MAKHENIGWFNHLFWSNCQSFFQPEKYYHCRPTEIFSRKSGSVTSDQQCDFPWNVESCICFNTRCHSILITHGVISRSAESILSDTTTPMQWTWHYNKSCFLLCTFCLWKERALYNTYYLQSSKSTKLIFAFEINMVDSSKNNSVKWFKMLWCYYASMHEFKYVIYFIGDLVCFERRLFELLSRGCIVSKTSSFEPKGFLLNKCNSKNCLHQLCEIVMNWNRSLSLIAVSG